MSNAVKSDKVVLDPEQFLAICRRFDTLRDKVMNPEQYPLEEAAPHLTRLSSELARMAEDPQQSLSTTVVTGVECLRELANALGLDGPIYDIRIELPVDDAASIIVKRWVTRDDWRSVSAVLSAYTLNHGDATHRSIEPPLDENGLVMTASHDHPIVTRSLPDGTRWTAHPDDEGHQ